jgi:hypothetical protein
MCTAARRPQELIHAVRHRWSALGEALQESLNVVGTRR